MRTTNSFDRKTLQGGPHPTGPHPVGSGFHGIYVSILNYDNTSQLGAIDQTTGEFIFVDDLEVISVNGYGNGEMDSRNISWISVFDEGKVVLKEQGVTERALNFTFIDPRGIFYDSANRLMYIVHRNGYEVFDELTETHVRSIPMFGFGYAFIHLSPDGVRIYETTSTKEITEFDPASGRVALYQQDSDDRYEFSDFGVHPVTGELWGLVTQFPQSGGQYKLRFIRIDPGPIASTNASPGLGTLVEDIVIFDWTDDPDNFHFSFDTAWDFDNGFGYWMDRGGTRIGRYNINTGEVIVNLFPDIFTKLVFSGLQISS